MSIHMNEAFDYITSIVDEEARKNAMFNYYIIHDIWGRFSIYIENANDDYIQKISIFLINYRVWINGVSGLDKSYIAYENIKSQAKNLETRYSNNIWILDYYLANTYWSGDNPNKKVGDSKVISFYSFKGGVGRTTTMMICAILMAQKGKKVVLLDFDLEAPGLSSFIKNDSFPKYGLVDFLIESNIYQKEIDSLHIDEYIYSIKSPDIIGNLNGEIYILPSFGSDITRENYLKKLMRIDLNTPNYLDKTTPIDFLLQKIQEFTNPDFIFIDSRAGIHQVGGITLTRYSDLAVLFFYGSQQNVNGMKVILPLISRKGIQFILVNSQVPSITEIADSEKEVYINGSYEALKSCKQEYADGEVDIDDESAEHYPIEIPYLTSAIFINNEDQLLRIIREGYTYYNDLVESINNYFLNNEDEDQIINNPVEILQSFKNLIPAMNLTPAAEDEFKDINDLTTMFYPMRNYSFIFEPRKFLVLGHKGTGKTALFIVLRHNDYAKALAKYVGADTKYYENTSWIVGVDVGTKYPSIPAFNLLSTTSISIIRTFWIALIIRLLYDNEISRNVVVNNVDEKLIYRINSEYSTLIRSLDVNDGLLLEEAIERIDLELNKHRKIITIIYDSLDKIIPPEHRGVVIGELIGIWYGFTNRLSSIHCKIFLRKDIYDREVEINDKSKIDNYFSNIVWSYNQLFALVWKRVGGISSNFRDMFTQISGQTEKSDSLLGFIPICDEEINKKLLERLIGRKMGGGNKAYTYRWFNTHLSDTNKLIVPRSMLDVFNVAASRESQNRIINMQGGVFRPKSFEESLPAVSERRVNDLKNEYPEYSNIFRELSDNIERVPVYADKLRDVLQKITGREDVNSIIESLIKIGVLKEYRRKPQDPLRYHIPDIYMYGLHLRRSGFK